ncbi:PIG-L family deacetylase [Arthrobacter sp. KK5.5]|uniref:PIG-L family deacetylase n=1 Tax=Arthrobacter sp. KK5.5 TaxID=3373084 RepID=UPI003EE73659
MVTFSHDDDGTPEAGWAAAGALSLETLPDTTVPGAGGRLVVVAAHPDDESLGAAGLIHAALVSGADVRVVLCSAGEASHPESPTHTPERLAAIRLAEFAAAMDGLRRSAAGARGVSADGTGTGTLEWTSLDLPDGRIAEHPGTVETAVQAAVETAMAAEVEEHLPGGAVATTVAATAPTATIAATYRFDGHPDHDAVGAAAARVAARLGVPLLEFPIWYWHWADPAATTEWTHWHGLRLSAGAAAAKRDALLAHASQVRPLSDAPGDGVLLSPGFLSHFDRPSETFRWSPAGRRDSGSAAAVFDALYTRDPDPWSYLTSEYERRKRAVTLAALPRRRYASALEAGCSIGVLTESLAERCGTVVGLDASAVAIAEARTRLAGLDNVELVRADLPGGWPAMAPGSLDLVVVSEIGYFLGPDELSVLLRRAAASLADGGDLLLCHWLHPIEGWELDGETVHRMAYGLLGWETVVLHRERDFLLEVFRAPDGSEP